MRHGTLDELDYREIATTLRRDVRTVKRVASGERIRGRIGQALIERAIAERLTARIT